MPCLVYAGDVFLSHPPFWGAGYFGWQPGTIPPRRGTARQRGRAPPPSPGTIPPGEREGRAPQPNTRGRASPTGEPKTPHHSSSTQRAYRTPAAQTPHAPRPKPSETTRPLKATTSSTGFVATPKSGNVSKASRLLRRHGDTKYPSASFQASTTWDGHENKTGTRRSPTHWNTKCPVRNGPKGAIRRTRGPNSYKSVPSRTGFFERSPLGSHDV